jgi:hypothetical protein
MKNVKFQLNYQRVLKVALVSVATFLLVAPIAIAQTSGGKPKFFI